ncbi:MAG: GNAT family N-acetyltransferase [Limisphaerales bacterium]
MDRIEETIAEWVAEYRLPSGAMVRFRHVQPEDEALISEAIRTASRETLLHRFFSPIRNVPPDLLRKMLKINRSREVCLVGVMESPTATRIICGVRYVRLDPDDTAEIALTVHDEFQRCGLGSFLLDLILETARSDGLRCVEAHVLASNFGMLKLLRRKLSGIAKWELTGDVYRVVIPLL